jgi:2-polyprenyl-6-methoxyphenol hydroxylase-like FAD-dependent oxidoreductase
MKPGVAVVGGGWAGCAAALTLAEAGVAVTLYEPPAPWADALARSNSKARRSTTASTSCSARTNRRCS